MRLGLLATALAALGSTAATENTCVTMSIADYGDVTIELADDQTPITVANFLDYVDSDFYDGLIFHRVIENFMIQGGGYTSDLTEKKTNSPIKNEASVGLSNTYGTISMARTSDPDSATDQFFINTVDNVFLDYSASSAGYAAFGTVIDGMDLVVAISEVKTHTTKGFSDVPKTDVVIESVKRTSCTDAASSKKNLRKVHRAAPRHAMH
eukprot:CAMPEP_0205903550 /NCGR_PEP_ID=MMETSP1325-20131115/170_1 /ASSEMBLY_ACC=CAM_ASM_000708 /TAXON_ID=236786 /ORGANISM="Florenciella sp., Strain RCC1007" /LENGTH=208 /DNA_ID=CAMNT_0053269213 /DNA_START=26 /DNA_END=652 /DNA_ORIENTATION=-